MRLTLRAISFSALGAMLVLLIAFVYTLNNRTDLNIWHTVVLDEEFTADSGISTLAEYMALEERLFKQLDERVYARVMPQASHEINRYIRGNLSDPGNWPQNWNRSYELRADSPKAAVLLLHGMSDSPYSLRHLGERLHDAGMHVLNLRMPGHGTAPSGLVTVSWQDMVAAVRLAVRHLEQLPGGRPLYIVGYSNGAALAVHYALAMLEHETLPRIDRLVVLSPAIGVSPVAALAIWQARLGRLLGLDKLAWNDILPEYDPFKYGSFAVNAGDVVYQLTNEIQNGLTRLNKEGKLEGFPPMLALSSVVDATVSTPELVSGLFGRLPAGEHKLVLFDINRMAELEPFMNWEPTAVIQAFQEDSDRAFMLSVVTNRNAHSLEMMVSSKQPGDSKATLTDLNLSWPEDVYSLSHVALPFPAEDSLYGGYPDYDKSELHLGKIALRGEKGALQIPASNMLRLRWNPFYPYVESRLLEFLGLDDIVVPAVSNHQ